VRSTYKQAVWSSENVAALLMIQVLCRLMACPSMTQHDRQWFDQSGWFDRKELTFRQIIDITFVGSMGPPGGGKQIITPRFIRHFNVVGYVEMSDASKAMIFGTILGNFLNAFDSSMQRLREPIVNATIEVFNVIIDQLLPTPSKRCVTHLFTCISRY
jgi:hypothetical protein